MAVSPLPMSAQYLVYIFNYISIYCIFTSFTGHFCWLPQVGRLTTLSKKNIMKLFFGAECSVVYQGFKLKPRYFSRQCIQCPRRGYGLGDRSPTKPVGLKPYLLRSALRSCNEQIHKPGPSPAGKLLLAAFVFHAGFMLLRSCESL